MHTHDPLSFVDEVRHAELRTIPRSRFAGRDLSYTVAFPRDTIRSLMDLVEDRIDEGISRAEIYREFMKSGRDCWPGDLDDPRFETSVAIHQRLITVVLDILHDEEGPDR